MQQGPLRKSVGKALRKCLEDNPAPSRDRKKRPRTPEGHGGGAAGQHQQHYSSPREEPSNSNTAGRQRKKLRAREGGGDADNSKSDHEVLQSVPGYHI